MRAGAEPQERAAVHSGPRPLTLAVFFLLLIPLSAWLRVSGMSDYYYSPDEAMHVDLARGSTLLQVLRFSTYETHPPLGHLLRHYWMEISGGVGFVRALSLLFGLALLPIYYVIGSRIGGRWTGICCALLVAFSTACVVQAYIVRNYSIFLFFLSLSLLFYQAWLKRQNLTNLAGYAVCGFLAVSSHFSGIFAVFCIGSVECIRLWRSHTPHRPLLYWIAGNAAVAAATLLLFYYWAPVISLTSAQYQGRADHAYETARAYAPLYSLAALSYFFSYPGPGKFWQFCLYLSLLGLFAIAWRGKSVQIYLALAAAAFALGTVLLATVVYPAGSNRYSLWLLPFVIPPLGYAFSTLCLRAREKLKGFPQADLLLCLLLAAAGGALCYSPQERIDYSNEIVMDNATREAFIARLRGLDASSFVVANRDSAFLFAPPEQNFYTLYPAPSKATASTFPNDTLVVPYYHTRLAFMPYYASYNLDDIRTLVRNLSETGTLNNVQQLVFISTPWDRMGIFNLLLCPQLTKQVLTFPSLPENTLTAKSLNRSPGVMLFVAKDSLLKQFVSPDGKAASTCAPTP